ncbi:hypothetical protein [Massilia phosphatilytica]
MLKHALDEHARNPGEKVDTYSISRVELMRTINYTSPKEHPARHRQSAAVASRRMRSGIC